MTDRQKGFTIIELLVATIIFSIVLVVILAAFLQIGRMFYKGVTINSVNDTTRNLVDTIVNDARLSSSYLNASPVSGSPNKYYFCVGNHRYTYVLYTQVKTGADLSPASAHALTHGIMQDKVGISCPEPSAGDGSTDPQQMLGAGMQLNNMVFSCNTKKLCSARAHVIFYGSDADVFEPSRNDPNARCSGSLLSTQYCASADISSNTVLRF